MEIIKKITNAPPGTYVIFYRSDCVYSQNALSKLREFKPHYKGYDISRIRGHDQDKIINLFKKNSSLLDFDKNHTTVPIVFLNGKFFGDAEKLINTLDSY